MAKTIEEKEAQARALLAGFGQLSTFCNENAERIKNDNSFDFSPLVKIIESIAESSDEKTFFIVKTEFLKLFAVIDGTVRQSHSIPFDHCQKQAKIFSALKGNKNQSKVMLFLKLAHFFTSSADELEELAVTSSFIREDAPSPKSKVMELVKNAKIVEALNQIIPVMGGDVVVGVINPIHVN